MLIGVNLLREGLDLPQVSLVAILDADKEGFLRNHRSLTQTAGRAARNVHGKVIMYADKITESMQLTINETERRRAKQIAYNEAHGIIPKPIIKHIKNDLTELYGETEQKAAVNNGLSTRSKKAPVQPRPYVEEEHMVSIAADPCLAYMSKENLERHIELVRRDMIEAAKRTDFIEAARYRDEMLSLQKQLESIAK